jgi:hypothetical protein
MVEYLKVWTSFRTVISSLNDSEKGRLFDAMLLYAETGEEPAEFKGNERFLWQAAKLDIDRTAQKCETLKKNGSLGGRPKTKENQTEPNETKENQTEPDERHNIKKDNIKKDNEKEITPTVLQRKAERFSPPTVDEVRAYCQERGNKVDANRFCDFYASKGWKVGSQPMKDWKAAVRTWEKDDRTRTTAVQTISKRPAVQDYEQRDYTDWQAELFKRSLRLADEIEA